MEQVFRTDKTDKAIRAAERGDDVAFLLTDLARQRNDLEAEQTKRQQRGEDLTSVLTKLAELGERIDKLKGGSGSSGDPAP